MARAEDDVETTVEQGEGPHPTPRSSAPESDEPRVVLPRGTTVGRYTILELVGQGGMGEVYAAYDPKLDRKIALKLLAARAPQATVVAEARLLREAQAIAKVSHPNVVTVHDAGTFGDRVFIAMEFVDGTTLKDWVRAGPRTRDEILAVFRLAARGLEAAHAAGLVHRDFKPQNVMVGHDGGVRVMDFGLVRQVNAGAELDDAATYGAPEARNVDGELTRTGELLGTPHYMAPEQFASESADARTDQFSFCVALYRALYGQRPFGGATLPELMANVVAGRISPPPSKSGVPGWVRRIVLRGLEVDRERRFPSMTALIAALDTDPTVRRRRIGLAAGLVVALALVAVGARRVAGSKQALCRGGGPRWASVWEPGTAPSARKDAIGAAFRATGRSFAETSFAGASRLLDDYVGKWLSMYVDACEATHVRGEQSNEVLDLRMGCLTERFTSVRALSDVLARADATVVENAVTAAGALPSLDRCANITLLKALVRPPDNEALRKRVDELRAEKARFGAEGQAGHCAEAARLAEALIPRVREAGYAPLLAETELAAGVLANVCTDLAVGMAHLKRAYTVALASRHDEVAAVAAIVLASFEADRLAHPVEGREWLSVAEALLQRFDQHPILDTWKLNSEARVLGAEGRIAEELATSQRERAEKTRLLGEGHDDAMMALNSVGLSLEAAGRNDEALAAFRQTRRDLVRTLGDDHPHVALVAHNEGEVLELLGRHAEAEAAYTRALEIWRRAGADTLFLAYALKGQGLAQLGLGRPAAAVAPLEEALRIRIERQAEAEALGETRFALARALWPREAARPRARALALEAHINLVGAKTPDMKRVARDLEAWLAANGVRN